MNKFKFKNWLHFLIGVAVFFIGIYILFIPIKTIVIVACLAVAGMFAQGLIRIISFFKPDTQKQHKGLILFGGLIDLVFGAILILNIKATALALCFIVGFWFLVSSILSIVRSLDYKSAGVKNWWVSLVFAIISTICSFYVIGNPILGGTIIAFVVAISLTSTGILLIANSFNE